MPRTRSIAWSELKLGIVGVVALVLVVIIVLAVGGEGGFWWQRYPLKTRFRDARGLKDGAVVRLSGKEVGTVTSRRVRRRRVDVAFEVRKEVRPLDHDGLGRARSDRSACWASRSSTSGAATTGTPLADWEYVQAGHGRRALSDLHGQGVVEPGQRRSADRRPARRPRHDRQARDRRRALQGAAAVRGVGRRRSRGSSIRARARSGALTKDPAAYQALKASLENLQAMTARINSGQGALGRFLNDEAHGQVAREHDGEPRADHGEAQERARARRASCSPTASSTTG